MPQSKNHRPLTVAQTAARFNVTARTIQRWVAADIFPGAYHSGPGTSAILIPIEDVLAYEKKLADAPGGAKAS